jgi:hypothetical protein
LNAGGAAGVKDAVVGAACAQSATLQQIVSNCAFLYIQQKKDQTMPSVKT